VTFTLGKSCYVRMAINQPTKHCVNLQRQVFLIFNAEPPIVASFSQLDN